MTEPNPESAEPLPPFLASLQADDAPGFADAVTPNARRSRRSLREVLSPSDSEPKPRKPAARVAAYRKDEFVEPVTQLYTVLGLGLMPFDQHCSGILVQQAPACAQAWDELAKTNPNVRKALRTLTQGTAWGAVIMAHVPIALAVASHHMPGLGESNSDNVSNISDAGHNSPDAVA